MSAQRHERPSAARAHEPVLMGRYQLVRQLGAGGSGVVYEALDLQNEARVALKMLSAPGAILRLKQEFRALSDLYHPNLVRLLELTLVDEAAFFTMELVEGTDFLTYVRPRFDLSTSGPGGPSAPVFRLIEHQASTRTCSSVEHDVEATRESDECQASPSLRPADGGAVDLGRLRSATGQLALAVSTLHAAGRIHRDLKPANIMVTPTGRVVLLDFGLVAEVGPAARNASTTAHVAGTLSYMSPEQVRGAPLTPASDWYALGTILFRALTGRLPFEGSQFDVAIRKQAEDAPRASSLAPGVDPDLEALTAELLARRPEARPDAAAILRRLQLSSGTTLPGVRANLARTTEITGREAHVRALEDAFEDCRRGRAVRVHVHGASGIGKSSLLEAFLRQRREREDALVLAGRCHERENVPFKAFDGIVDALFRVLRRLPESELASLIPPDAGTLEKLFPVLAELPGVRGSQMETQWALVPHPMRARAFACFRELFVRLTRRYTIVLAIDDFQWADSDDAALVRELISSPQPPPILLVLCHRPEVSKTKPALAALLGAQTTAEVEVREIEVGPLSAAESFRLAHRLLGPELAGPSEALARESEGHPYLLEELAFFVRSRSSSLPSEILRRVVGDGAFGEPSPRAALSLKDVLLTRVRGLPRPARRVLEVLAVAGRPLSETAALDASKVEAENVPAITVLRAERLIRAVEIEGTSTVDVYHVRIREAVLARLEAARIREIHLQLAEVLSRSSTDPNILAHHFEGGGDLAQARWCHLLAGRQANAVMAFAHAAQAYRRVLELGIDDDAQRAKVEAELGDALAHAGRHAEAASTYLAAVATRTREASAMDATELRSLKRRAVEQLLRSGMFREGMKLAAELEPKVAAMSPSTVAGGVLRTLGLRVLIRLRGLSFRARPAEEIPAAELERADACSALTIASSVLWWAGEGPPQRLHMVRALLFEARTLLLALHLGEPRRVARAMAIEVVGSILLGLSYRVREVRRHLDALAARAQAPYLSCLTLLLRSLDEFIRGDWQAASEHAAEVETSFDTMRPRAGWEAEISGTIQLVAQTWLGRFEGLPTKLSRQVERVRRHGDPLSELLLIGAHYPQMIWLADGQVDRVEHEICARKTRAALGSGLAAKNYTDTLAEVQFALYLGDGKRAWRVFTKLWGTLEGSSFFKTASIACESQFFRARAALAAALETPEDRPQLVRWAETAARAMRQRRRPWTKAISLLVQAQIAHLTSSEHEAETRYVRAIEALERSGLEAYAHAARWRLGEVLGGASGAVERSAAEKGLRASGVRDPERMVALLAPVRGPASR